jgi:hypothetical protein
MSLFESVGLLFKIIKRNSKNISEQDMEQLQQLESHIWNVIPLESCNLTPERK